MRKIRMAQRKEQIQYVPLKDRDYSLKGFEFEGDLVVLDAMRRWAIKPVGEYCDFLRRAYFREAELSGGHVVNMGKDDSPLTPEQAALVDPYALAVKYDDNDYSSHHRGQYGAGTQIIMGDPCECGSSERTVQGKCHPCQLEAQHRQQEAYRAAHPELEEARLAKLRAREEKWAAQRVAHEEAVRIKQETAAARKAEATALRVAREAARREILAERATAREEARIVAARVRAAASRDRQDAPNNKFEGKPCKRCGSTTRYIKSKDCVACMRGQGLLAAARVREKQALPVGTV